MDQILNAQDLSLFEEDYEKRDGLKKLQNNILRHGINESCIDESLYHEMKDVFSVEVKTGKVTNQRQSGRCWMFAGLNVLREILKETLNVKEIELSQAYLQFYDKLEKANFFLEKGLEHADEELDSRDNVFLLDSALGDGGHFHMFTNLVKKYGVVPFDVMPDEAVSKNTSELNQVLTRYLMQGYLELREAKREGAKQEVLETMKQGYLNDVYRILKMSLGNPVSSFTYEYEDKDGKFVRLENLTPKQFYERYLKEELDDYICLADAPLNGMKQYQKYTCDLVNNVIGGDPVIFFNVPLSVMKDALIKSLEDKRPCWFAADVSTQSLRKEGILADGILQRKELFSLNYTLNKSQRANLRASFCNHAMTFTGVNLVDGVPNRYKVQNSWGEENGFKGYYIMSDAWFDEYVYEVFVNKKYLDPEVVEKYEKSTIEKQSPYNTLWIEMN